MIPILNNVDISDAGATIEIQVDANTSIVCKALSGSNINAAVWKVRKIINTTDTNFGGYPYMRILCPIINGKAVTEENAVANLATTYTYA